MMKILQQIFPVIFFLAAGSINTWAYDPEHDDLDPAGVEAGLLDDDGDRGQPPTGFPLNVTTCSTGSPDALCASRASFVIPTNNGDTFQWNTSSGTIIDITQPPFGAIPDDGLDDTLAFQKAITFVVSMLYTNTGSGNQYDVTNPGGTKNFIIYVPQGVYEVNDTLTYKTQWNENGIKNLTVNGVTYGTTCANEVLYVTATDSAVQRSCNAQPPGTYVEAFARLRIIGQNRTGTIIKATGAWTPAKPILSFGNPHSKYNSSVSMNTLRNLTIDASETGATGVQFSGANNAGIHNVSIINGSTSGYGIYIKSAATQGYHSDILIDGFSRAINSEVYHATQSTFEHVTITDAIRAIQTQHSGLSLRKILITQSHCGQPLWLTGSGQIVLIDSTISTLSGSCFASISNAFVLSASGHVHSRGLKLENSESAYAADWSNWNGSSFSNTTFYQSARPTLALQPSNPSEYDYSGYTSKVITSESELSSCFNFSTCSSSTNYILFLSLPVVSDQPYNFTQQHTVPANIKVINFLYGSFTSNNYLFTSESSSESLVIEDITSIGALFEHTNTSIRPLILRHVGGPGSPYQNSSSEMQNVYFESVNSLGNAANSFKNVNAWARSINTEMCKPLFDCIADPITEATPLAANFPISGNSKVWVLGYKTEKSQPGFSVENDGDELEVLGGFVNQRHGAFFSSTDADDPTVIPYSMLAIKNSNALVSYIGFTSGLGVSNCTDDITGEPVDNPHFHFNVITNQTVQSPFQTFWSNYPNRTVTDAYCNDIFIPLFTTDNDSDGLTNRQENILLTDPLNRLDPPRVNFSRDILVGFDDIDYLNTGSARYSSWFPDSGLFNGSGPIDKNINSYFVPVYTYGCKHVNRLVYCGEGQELDNVAKVESGGEDSCALLTSGELKCWNRDIVTGAYIPTPVSVLGLNDNPIRDFSVHLGADSGTACAIGSTNSYVCWQNSGNYDSVVTANYTNPYPVTFTSLSAVAVGRNHVCFIDSGKVYCQTSNNNLSGQLGSDTSPADGYVDGITDARKIVAGDNFTCVLHGAYEIGDGVVTCWGAAPLITPQPQNPVSITAMGNDVCVIDAGAAGDTAHISNALKCFPAIDMDSDDDSILDPDDTDVDGDNVLNVTDAFPFDPTESVDTDGDLIGNNADADDDNDGLIDTQEVTLGTNAMLKDTDGDNVCDGNGSACTPMALNDNCPLVANTSQLDRDSDGLGNMCDPYLIEANSITTNVSQDGYILNNGAPNTTALTLLVGDSSKKETYRSFLDFTLPNDLVSVTAVSVNVTRTAVMGVPNNPSMGSTLPIAMSVGGFSGSAVLQSADATAAATVTTAATLPIPAVNQAYSAALTSTAVTAINTGLLANTRLLQFRIACTGATDYDSANDYYSFASANHGTAAARPLLMVTGIRP